MFFGEIEQKMVTKWPSNRSPWYPTLRNSASGPEVVSPGWILAGLSALRPAGGPAGGPMSVFLWRVSVDRDLEVFPVAVQPKSGPEG